jgi:hypothetical protein
MMKYNIYTYHLVVKITLYILNMDILWKNLEKEIIMVIQIFMEIIYKMIENFKIYYYFHHLQIKNQK